MSQIREMSAPVDLPLYIPHMFAEGKIRMASTVAVANRFIELSLENSDPLTPMQLLKLVYIAHGWMLGLTGRPLINDRVEAWQYGPVIPGLYARVRESRGAPIVKKISALFDKAELDADEADIINQVYNAYKKFTGIQLSRMTHADGTPWALSYEHGTFGKVIPVDLIEEHYKRLSERKTA